MEGIEWIWSLGKFGSKPGLERMNWMLKRLGNPQCNLPVIHVAGTNGKGSTCFILERILTKAGYRVGLFTSPFVLNFTERIVYNSNPISNKDLEKLIQKIKPLAEQAEKEGLEHPTQFEMITVLAILYYSSVDVDIVILETGLGGRLDATNVIEPIVSVITNVDFDHTDVLGNTLEEIAREKAGIVKDNTPIVTGIRNEKAVKEIEKYAHVTNSSTYLIKRDFSFDESNFNGKNFTFNYKGLYKELEGLELSLIGKHQLHNASLALCCTEILQTKGYKKIQNLDIYDALLEVKIPIRMELLTFLKKGDIMLDAAHNPAGIAALMQGLEDMNVNQNWGKIVFLTGALKDKQIEKMIDNFFVLPDEIIITKPNNKRSANPEEIEGKLQKFYNNMKIKTISEIEKATYEGINATNKKGLLVIFGSFYLVAEAKKYIKESF
ncbi:bifunctional folylpolyglutamate synthase/dihydrofolate synthase [Natranaerobius trueperi]|uniref:Dihydrofolate synthase/folylpolyglutamate synthase n=1 Tax=Natranaerobius trueperi TaxID=759412 RepID=A0A226BY16_9FIRM|nr:folylpolyglutamate synthase/dihydrofolate synthase family protein [Natranaerobius trueperi]OWZ83896.1 folylpolyglutamate synthase/dihydrofolate synthase [Natranaerobius trueperi]